MYSLVVGYTGYCRIQVVKLISITFLMRDSHKCCRATLIICFAFYLVRFVSECQFTNFADAFNMHELFSFRSARSLWLWRWMHVSTGRRDCHATAICTVQLYLMYVPVIYLTQHSKSTNECYSRLGKSHDRIYLSCEKEKKKKWQT